METIRRNRYFVVANALISLAVVLVVIVVVGYFGWFSAVPGISSANLHRLELTGEENRIISVVKASNPSVVSIVISKKMVVPGVTPVQSAIQEIGGGTGFLVSPDGLIVTNKHVVDDPAATYIVYTFDGKKYPAKVAAKDPTQDVAILKISDGNDLPYLSFGDSNQLSLGQTVVAIGNVFDQFKNSVSVGVVSGLSRTIVAGDYFGNTESLDNVIQTDAAINPGNSGGPLLDTSDRVVGVNVAIARGSENVGFALPSNIVKNAVNSVIRTGKILRPYLGVRYIIVNEIVKDQFNLPYDYGALVTSDPTSNVSAVEPGSPAARAGITDGDVILEVDGQKLTGNVSLAGIFQIKNVGDVIGLKVWHAGKIRDIKVKLAEFPIS